MRRSLLLALTTVLLGFALSHSLACGGRQRPAANYPTTPNMNARRYRSLEQQAAKDLTCGSEQLKYTYAPDGMHTMTGCGGTQSYFLHCPSSWCVWMSSPANQGAFDLNCPIEQVQMVNLDKTKWGITGCGGRATYAPLCQGGTCQWFQDAATTSATGSSGGSAAPDNASVIAPAPAQAAQPASPAQPTQPVTPASGLAPAAPR